MSDMTLSMIQWEVPRRIPENEEFVTWARSQGEPHKKGGIDFGGYELHAHPDLGEVLPELVTHLPTRLVNACGVPAVANDVGLVFAFAFGTCLYIRAVSIPDAECLDKLVSEWAGVNPWFPPQWTMMTLEARLATKASTQSTWLAQVRSYLDEAHRLVGR